MPVISKWPLAYLKITTKRIIEREQTNGIVIYQFYTVAADGTEKNTKWK